MKKYFSIILLIFIFLIVSTTCGKKKSQKNQPNGENKFVPSKMQNNQMKSKFITFKINKDKWPDIDYFSRILTEYFISGGIKMQLVNMSDTELLGICEQFTKIDKEALLDNFKDVLESVDFAN